MKYKRIGRHRFEEIRHGAVEWEELLDCHCSENSVEKRVCRWEYDSEDISYTTSCNHKHELDYGYTEIDKNYIYCPYCGDEIIEQNGQEEGK